MRGAVWVSDGGHTAVARLLTADVDVHHLFGTLEVRWLHPGEIWAALSDSAAAGALVAGRAARNHLDVVSYALNYISAFGGPSKVNDRGAIAWSPGIGLVKASSREGL